MNLRVWYVYYQVTVSLDLIGMAFPFKSDPIIPKPKIHQKGLRAKKVGFQMKRLEQQLNKILQTASLGIDEAYHTCHLREHLLTQLVLFLTH